MTSEKTRLSMLPRYCISIGRRELATRTYRVRVRKGWWSGPGTGATGRDVLDHDVVIAAHSDESEALCEVLLSLVAELRTR